MKTSILIINVLLIACIMASCTKPLPTEAEGGATVAEDRGTLLTPSGSVQIVWPKNTNAIFYLSGNVMTVNVQTKDVSTVFDVGSGWATSLLLSPDYSWLYFRAGPQYGSADMLYRVSTTPLSTPQIIRQPVFDFCVAPDNVHLACSENDTLHICDVTKGTDVSVPMVSPVTPLLFSPDGKQVLCSLSKEILSPPDYVSYSLETGQTSALPGFRLSYGNPRLARWDDSGLKIVQVDGFSPMLFTLVNYSTSENRLLGQTSGSWPGDDFGWSADGKRFAYWDGKILSYNGWNVGVVQYSLRSIDMIDNRTDLIAVANTSSDWQDGGPGQIAFSGDSRSVAYIFSGRIYLKSIP